MVRVLSSQLPSCRQSGSCVWDALDERTIACIGLLTGLMPVILLLPSIEDHAYSDRRTLAGSYRSISPATL